MNHYLDPSQPDAHYHRPTTVRSTSTPKDAAMSLTHRSHDMTDTDKLREALSGLIQRAYVAVALFDSLGDYDTTEWAEDARQWVADARDYMRPLNAALAAAPQPTGCGLPCGFDCNGACFDAAAPQPAPDQAEDESRVCLHCGVQTRARFDPCWRCGLWHSRLVADGYKRLQARVDRSAPQPATPGQRMIRAAEEAVAIARGEAEPASVYPAEIDWGPDVGKEVLPPYQPAPDREALVEVIQDVLLEMRSDHWAGTKDIAGAVADDLLAKFNMTPKDSKA